MPQKKRKKPLYEGKAKSLYEGPEPGTLIQHFKDDATAFNNQKKGTITGKGVINNRISEFLMTNLADIGVPTHFVRGLNMREQLVLHVDVIPVEVVVRNIAAGSMCKRLGVEEGMTLLNPIIEFYYKDDALGDPMITEDHILNFGWMSPEELDIVRNMTYRINDFLQGIFAGCKLKLVDFKLEFGRYELEEDDLIQILLADEISPDNCRLWDMESGEKMDKDRFRQDLGGEAEAYQEVARRLGVLATLEADESEESNVKELKK